MPVIDSAPVRVRPLHPRAPSARRSPGTSFGYRTAHCCDPDHSLVALTDAMLTLVLWGDHGGLRRSGPSARARPADVGERHEQLGFERLEHQHAAIDDHSEQSSRGHPHVCSHPTTSHKKTASLAVLMEECREPVSAIRPISTSWPAGAPHRLWRIRTRRAVHRRSSTAHPGIRAGATLPGRRRSRRRRHRGRPTATESRESEVPRCRRQAGPAPLVRADGSSQSQRSVLVVQPCCRAALPFVERHTRKDRSSVTWPISATEFILKSRVHRQSKSRASPASAATLRTGGLRAPPRDPLFG